jgi:hypothetical protein
MTSSSPFIGVKALNVKRRAAVVNVKIFCIWVSLT